MAEGGSDQGSAEYQRLGDKHHQKGEYLEAVEQYTLEISADPTNHILYSKRSATQAKLQDFEAALSDADEVIRLQPAYAKGYSRKGTALQSLGRLIEAKSAFEKGLELEPDNKAMQDGLEECEAEIEGPASSDPIGNPFANIETILPRLREDEKTSKFAEDPSFMDMLMDLGQNPLNMQKYLKDDRLRLTLSALLGFELEHPDKMNFNEPPFVNDSDDEGEESEIETNTEKARKFKDLGTACLKSKEYAKAIEHYDRAIALDATDLSFYSNKALAYQFQGQSREIRETSFALVEVWRKSGGNETIVAKSVVAFFFCRNSELVCLLVQNLITAALSSVVMRFRAKEAS